MKRTPILSVTKKDLDVQTFRSGGKGGQHQNTCNSGVRIVHRDSKAVGECRETRKQGRNKKIAFKRMVESEKFQKWLRMAVSRSEGHLDASVDEAMRPCNLKIETFDPNLPQ